MCYISIQNLLFNKEFYEKYIFKILGGNRMEIQVQEGKNVI